MSVFEEKKIHPAYGMVRIGRVNGGDGRFFGSHIDCKNYISITISNAEKSNNLGRDWFFTRNEKIEIALTPTQFSELLTTENGSGVPCTIKKFNGAKVESIPIEEKTEAKSAIEYFEKNIKKLSKNCIRYKEEVNDILGKKSISNSDRDDIRMAVRSLIQEIESNIPFYLESFNKSAQKIVTQAKSEVDAFTTHIIKKAGLEAIAKSDFPKLLNDKN